MSPNTAPNTTRLAINDEHEAIFLLDTPWQGVTMEKLVGSMELACKPMLLRAVGREEKTWCASLEVIRTGGNLVGESLRVRARYIGLHGDLLVFEVNAETNSGGLARGLLMNQVERDAR